jgi:drug/metabolite transporter (DMT)-like permease
LLMQPVFAIVWGRLFFQEALSLVQWCGTALVLGGVATISSGRLTIERAEGGAEA